MRNLSFTNNFDHRNSRDNNKFIVVIRDCAIITRRDRGGGGGWGGCEMGVICMSDLRENLVPQGGEEGGRRDMMLQRMTVET